MDGITETEGGSATVMPKYIWRMEPSERFHDYQKMMPTFINHVLKVH